jgi:hypothetical protein
MYKLMKIYYDKMTGEVIWYVKYFHQAIIDFDHDYEVVKELNERVKESIGLLVLENGQYSQDFDECDGFRVNPETLELEFSYPDPNATEPQELVYQKPLTEQIMELKTENQELRAELAQTNADLVALAEIIVSTM